MREDGQSCYPCADWRDTNSHSGHCSIVYISCFNALCWKEDQNAILREARGKWSLGNMGMSLAECRWQSQGGPSHYHCRDIVNLFDRWLPKHRAFGKIYSQIKVWYAGASELFRHYTRSSNEMPPGKGRETKHQPSRVSCSQQGSFRSISLHFPWGVYLEDPVLFRRSFWNVDK